MGLISALGFLTRIPVGRRALETKSLARAVAYFPLVGLLLGFIIAGADYGMRLVFPELLSSAMVVALLMLFTGALHFEGFVDSCDGLFGGHSRERRLEIMRRKNVGAYAIAGGALLLLLKCAAISSLPADAGRFWVLALFPCMSRWGMALAVGLFPYARQEGLGTAFRHSSPIQIAIAGIIALMAAGLLGSTAGLILFSVATVLALLLGYGICRMLGGLTGDTYGAINESIEVALLLVAAGILPSLAMEPFWRGGF